ncbi:MAG: HAMP domain-containing histidine kinase [Lachnospiraceae bacterium]|nr:HAMP domain-containing histidine kinase [Lachnospiraceae bacterium]
MGNIRRTEKKSLNARMKRLKKPIFYKIFLKRLALFATVAILAGIVGTVIGAVVYDQYKIMESAAWVGGLEKDVQAIWEKVYGKDFSPVSMDDFTAGDGEDMPLYSDVVYSSGMDIMEAKKTRFNQFKTRLHYKFAQAAEIVNLASGLYSVRNQIPYVDSSQAVFILLKMGDSTQTEMYECDLNEQWRELFASIDKEQGVENWMIEMQEVYIQDGKFVPGKMKLSQNSDKDMEWKTVAEYDMTPENKEDYEYCRLSEDSWHVMVGPILVGIDKDNPVQKAFDEFVSEKENLQYDLYTMWEKGMSADVQKIELSNGLDVKLINIGVYNFYEEYGRELVCAYVSLAVLAILLALFVAYLNYKKSEAIYQMDSYRRETANAMAHDLKTPLTAIIGYAENLRAHVHSEKKEHYAAAILDNAQYMNGMIGNILDLAKVEMMEHDPVKEEVNLQELTDSVVKKFEIQMQEKQITFSVSGEAVIQADVQLMTRVLENLLGNAVKYALEKSQIRICMDADCYKVINAVEDEPEISAMELWKPFVKGNNSRRSMQGTGIGLTIVKNILELHDFLLKLCCEEKEFVVTINY